MIRLGRDIKMLLQLTLVWVLLLAFAAGTPLDDYVNAPDPYYEYRDMGQPFRGADYTTYFLNMTSQKWLNGKLQDWLRPSNAGEESTVWLW